MLKLPRSSFAVKIVYYLLVMLLIDFLQLADLVCINFYTLKPFFRIIILTIFWHSISIVNVSWPFREMDSSSQQSLIIKQTYTWKSSLMVYLLHGISLNLHVLAGDRKLVLLKLSEIKLKSIVYEKF